MICETCKIIIPDSAAACPRCGIYLQAEDLSAETSVRAEKQKTMLICPKCGAAHTLTAQFCRNDGTLLKESFSKKQEHVQTEIGQNLKKYFKAYRWASVLALALLLAGSGIYLYFPVHKGLKTDNLTVVPNNTNSSDSGQIYPTDSAVQNQNSENLLLSSPKMEKSPVDIARLEVEINRALRKKGIYGIYVEVHTDLVASLTGTFITKKDREKALNLIASYKELTGVREVIISDYQSQQVSIAKLSAQINNALKDAGIRGVVVEVNDALHVTLKGAVSSTEEKNKAFEIAGLFKEAKRIKDLIFIVES
jgi:osmotically-inducible protein OsmY/predicted RNA-binding Zn-ribbon protein involved in translation (DUF1610 family)